MPPTPDIATAATQQLLDALAERPDASAAELADAAGIGRSTASKLLVTLAAQGRALRRPGGHQGGRRTPERWTLITTTATTRDTTAASPALAATPAPRLLMSTGPRRHRAGWGLASSRSWWRRAWPSGRTSRCRPRRSPRRWTARPVRSPTPSRPWPARDASFRPRPTRAAMSSPLPATLLPRPIDRPPPSRWHPDHRPAARRRPASPRPPRSWWRSWWRPLPMSCVDP